MSDPSESKPRRSIPSWQQAQTTSSEPTSESTSETPPETPPETPSEASEATPSQSTERESGRLPPEEKDAALIEQAKKFLTDPSIRDAPVERKRVFLESKGLSRDEISQLLGEAPTEKHDTRSLITAEDTANWAKTQSQSRPQPDSQPPAQQSPREIPPIVTYPEFLTQPTKPPPLVTKTRLLNTIYGMAALTTTFYGLSKYIVEPMAASLTSARHEFSENTRTKLEDLNTRLRVLASQDPSEHVKIGTADSATGDDDMESVHSDPTELFHRDYGTQTSPHISRRGSQDSSSSGDNRVSDTVTSHENRLKILTSHLNELKSSTEDNKNSSTALSKQIQDLSQYLSEIRYQTPYQQWMGSYSPKPGAGGQKDDAIEQFRTDIRSVKGVLLSARNFPASGGSARLPGRYGS